MNDSLSLENLSYYIDDILLFSFLIGFIGLIEDFAQNLSSKLRLSLIMTIVAVSMGVMHEILPYKLGLFDLLEGSIKTILVYLFTVIMISGFVNAGNIADGANGLLSLIYLVFFLFANSLIPSIFYSSMI